MQPFEAIHDTDDLYALWKQFTQTGHTQKGVDPLVAASWRRCNPRLNPLAPPNWKYLGPDMLERALAQNHLIRSIARPIMEDVYQFTERANALVILLDSTLCVTDMLGDPDTSRYARRMGLERGAYLSESLTGTNAFAVSQLEGTPAWVYGPEHFLHLLHGLSSVAAPVYNLEGGLVGVIGLIERVEQCSVQSLGLAMVAAKAIEGQLRAELVGREANEKVAQMNSILDSMSDGFLAWDTQGIVTYLNHYAGSLLGLRPATLVGRPLSESITLPKTLARATILGEELSDIEASFNVNGMQRSCVASLRIIQTNNSVLYLCTLKRIEQVRELVNRQVGAQAHLTIEDIIGESQPIQRLRKRVKAAAKADACVLVVGEKGTGKNTLVRAIHNISGRANGPFIAINCRAIPRDLVLAEFLGFDAGAFNNQNGRGQPSKFELADGGTLYLDEIEALTLDMQAALLRIIESGDVLRLGGKRAVPVDVRVIVSTSNDLEEYVNEGAFRSDLLFRLRSFVINTTPLRKRPEDLVIIVKDLLHRYGRTFSISERALKAINNYHWPGNIRELEAAIERAASLCEDHQLKFKHLPRSVREGSFRVENSSSDDVVAYSLAEAEKQAIIRAGQASKGNLTQAAAILGIGRSTLWRKMKAMNLSSEDFILEP